MQCLCMPTIKELGINTLLIRINKITVSGTNIEILAWWKHEFWKSSDISYISFLPLPPMLQIAIYPHPPPPWDVKLCLNSPYLLSRLEAPLLDLYKRLKELFSCLYLFPSPDNPQITEALTQLRVRDKSGNMKHCREGIVVFFGSTIICHIPMSSWMGQYTWILSWICHHLSLQRDILQRRHILKGLCRSWFWA